MSKFTLYRADIDSARLARVLDKVPGVAVATEQSGDRRADETPGEPTDEAASTVETEDDSGLRERIPVPDTDTVDEEQSSVVRTYGLLGLGVSMVMLGFATVGIWVYLRRQGSEGEAETPPPATGLDADEPTAETGPAASGLLTDETTTGRSETTELSVVRPDEPASAEQATDEPEPDHRGRAEGDRSDIEWTTRDPTPAAEPSARESDEPEPEVGESDADEDEPRPTEPIDAAPLLGAAFLAVTGAVVKWLQADDQP